MKRNKNESQVPEIWSYRLNSDDEFELYRPGSEKKKTKKGKLSLITKLLLVIDLCAVCCFAVAYGPWGKIREWLVTTAMSTWHHKYFAYILYSEEKVDEIIGMNSSIESKEQTDASAIKFIEQPDTGVYSSIYEEQILKKDEGNDEYKVIEIKENGYAGFITVVYHPENLDFVISRHGYGSTITEFAEDNNASVAVNASGFGRDSNNICYANCNLIVNGKVFYSTHKTGRIIGMNNDNVLCLLKATAEEAVKQGMRWGCEFGPFLIVNGEPTKFTGNGGYGLNPRTAIGQRQDGIVLLVTIDGRGGSGSSGIDMVELTEIFLRYGCYNAANLDGGGSTMLAVEGELRNNPTGWGYSGERYIYNALVLKNK